MNKNEEMILLKNVINEFGANNQIIKSIEELSELTTALARYFVKNEEDINNIHEEIADVQIMIDQLNMIFDSEIINHYRTMKLNRLIGKC